MSEVKTNAMRILDQKKIPYSSLQYDPEGGIDGISVAQKTGLPPEQVYKTLVTRGKSRGYFVFVIPVDAELDLKKAAKSVNEKSVEMIHVKEINSVTGYIRGGCSPIGMKKAYPVVIHNAAENLQKITVSGGRIGSQIQLSPRDLAAVVDASFTDLIK